MDLPCALIMEDDAVLLGNDFQGMGSKLMSQLPPSYDVLYFAYINGTPSPHVRGDLFKGVYVWTTAAYVLSNQGARKLLEVSSAALL